MQKETNTNGDVDAVHTYEMLVEHDELTAEETPNIIDRFIKGVASVLCWGVLILMFVILLQVVLRYGFRSGFVVLEELQWHLYAVGIMFGLSFAQVTDSHVRVDVLKETFSERTQRVIEILGLLLLLLPFCWVVFSNSLDFVWEAWRVNESSDAPIGLCCRWAVKSIIPLSIGLLILAAVSRLLHDIDQLFGSNISGFVAPLVLTAAILFLIYMVSPYVGEIFTRLYEGMFKPLFLFFFSDGHQ